MTHPPSGSKVNQSETTATTNSARPSSTLALPPQPSITTTPTPNLATTYPQYPQYPPSATSYKPPTNINTSLPQPTQQQAAYAHAQSYFAHSPYAYTGHTGFLNSPAPGTPPVSTGSPYPYPSMLPSGSTAYGTYAASPQVKTQSRLSVPSAVTSSTTNVVSPSNAVQTKQWSTTAATGSQVPPTPATGVRGGKKPVTFKGAFAKDLRSMMYGFGDDPDPAPDTVNVMEEILMEYIADVCLAAQTSSSKGTIKLEDLRRVLSRPADTKKLARMEELLFMQENIKRARAQFETEDQATGTKGKDG